MKTVVFFLVTAFTLVFSHGQDAQGVTITVTIDNVINDEGKVLISLHSVDTFLRGPGIMDQESVIKDGKVEFTFENVATGTYAIMAMHDANDNKRMDYADSGMPTESYGMSGNEMTMGPPTFDAAKFDVADNDLEFNIRF